jgi:hypothetical protein
MIAVVRDGKLIAMEGDYDHIVNRGSLCVKGISMFATHASPNRLKTPLYRAPGSDHWEDIWPVDDRDFHFRDWGGRQPWCLAIMCLLSQVTQRDIMQQVAMQEMQSSLLQWVQSVNVGKPQITFVTLLLSSV